MCVLSRVRQTGKLLFYRVSGKQGREALPRYLQGTCDIGPIAGHPELAAGWLAATPPLIHALHGKFLCFHSP